ncbi:nuclear transport factor 2 family protein [Gillisia hiemivivida]|uniref:Nuclear transport factor 2 family protein n=1 Tax=Gillisia hiemivivida TaxID=291190 RepID=A0A5C6ZSY2_9FLAO|nr:nuclear transport factor 2 family protein [Gillisia hiemivivida]TXD93195.1 nuclear transport factor 2 family protein [Gillisia hiemivivida]
MASSEKHLVESFYNSEFYKDPSQVSKHFHPDAELFWNSSAGFNKMSVNDLEEICTEMGKSFEYIRPEISHLLQDDKMVTIRITFFTKTIENPDEEIPMTHMVAIWEIKDGKMFKGYQMSQPADDSPDNLASFMAINL